jgi:prepilin-type N-terminal cleavage/methylation domain-containing protein
MRYHLSAPAPVNRDGFTMIEMLIVFVVFGVAAMISIRSVGDTLRRDRVRKTAAVLSADVEQAFAIAARQRAPIRLLFDSAKKTFSVALRSDTTYKFRTRSFGNTGDMQLDYISVNRNTLDIIPNGLAADTLRLTLGIFSKGGATYSTSLRATRGGLVRVGNR